MYNRQTIQVGSCEAEGTLSASDYHCPTAAGPVIASVPLGRPGSGLTRGRQHGSPRVFWARPLGWLHGGGRREQVCASGVLSGLLSFTLCAAGQSNAERLSGHLSLCRRPGRYQRSCQQWRPAADGKGGQSASQTGEGEPHGRLEVLHVLGLLGFSSINTEPPRRWGSCNLDPGICPSCTP